MRVRLPYGKGFMDLEVDDRHLKTVLHPKHMNSNRRRARKIWSVQALDIARSIHRNFERLAQGKKRIVIISSDHTRPVPSHVIMPILLREIR